MKKTLLLIMVLALTLGLAGMVAADYEIKGWDYSGTTVGSAKLPITTYYGQSTFIWEGSSVDAFETTFTITNPTADRTITFPNETGTVLTSAGGAITSLPLADTKIWIGGSDGLADPQTVSGDATITNAGVVTVGKVDNKNVDFADVTDAKIQVATDAGGGSWDAVAVSGDVTITNAGVVSIGNNKVGTAEANFNSVALVIAAGTQFNTVAVESGSTLLGFQISDGGAINGTTVLNTITYSGTTLKVTMSGTDGGNDQTITATFLRP